MIDTDHIRIDIYDQSVEGLDSLLAWWTTFGFDNVRNRFYGEVGNNNQPNESATLMVIQRARILWFFSVVSQKENYSQYKRFADIQYEELVNHFYNENTKGFFWELDQNYSVLKNRKQSYAQAFCIYALSEYYLLSGNNKVKRLAYETFSMLESKVWDNVYHGYIEALDHDWSAMEDMRLSDKDQNVPKTMNTHLHIIEAYTTLCKVTGRQDVQTSLERVTRLYVDKFYNEKSKGFQLFFDNEWCLCSDIISYGHDIESSWLLYEAAQMIDDEIFTTRIKKIALDIVEEVIHSGINIDGAVKNEVHIKVTDTSYDWWPQAEGVVGFINAYEIDQSKSYLAIAQKCLSFIDQHIVDHDHGEWYWKISTEYEVDTTISKSNGWKAPYHNGRMYIEILHRLSNLENERSKLTNIII